MKLTHQSPFGTEETPDLGGYVSIVTGGNSGIGYETVFQLASHSARVYIAARSSQRINEAISRMKAATPTELDLHPLIMDLQNLKSVKEAGDTFMEKESRLDILINNAGIMAIPFQLTVDGFELHWQTNYLAPFLLVKTLLPILKSTAATSPSPSRVRIVNVSSDAAVSLGVKELDLERPNLEYITGKTAAWRRYAHSKLAQLLHARTLHTHLHQHPDHSHNISAYSLHPGIVPTNLQSADPSFFPGAFVRFGVRWGIFPGTVSVKEGARTTLFCAVSGGARSGEYYVPGGKVGEGAGEWIRKYGEGGKVEAGLWEGTLRMLGEKGF
ncbi:hypothetical protein Q9189_008104 [Teloschistes chrysophthalmus]